MDASRYSGYKNALYGFFVETRCMNVCWLDEKRIQGRYILLFG